MESMRYRYEFEQALSMEEVEATLHLAIVAAESIFGSSTVRMDARYSIDEQRCFCVVDASSKVGRCICQIFTGYLTREFGGGAFRVRPTGGREPVMAGSSA